MRYNHSKNSLYYLIFALIAFLILITSELTLLLEPLYKDFKYGEYNEMFEYLIKFFYVMILSIILLVIFKKKNLITFYDKSELSNKRILCLYALVIIPIFIISACLGWKFKILYDLGDNFTGPLLVIHLIKVVAACSKTFIITLMLFGIQKFIDTSFEITFKHNKLVPFSGLVLMLTFGIFELITGTHQFYMLYLLANIYFGIIFTLTNKSIGKSYLLITLLYLL